MTNPSTNPGERGELSPEQRQRLFELLADASTSGLAADDAAELDTLLGHDPSLRAEYLAHQSAIGELLVAMDRAVVEHASESRDAGPLSGSSDTLPKALSDTLVARGTALVGGQSQTGQHPQPTASTAVHSPSAGESDMASARLPSRDARQTPNRYRIGPVLSAAAIVTLAGTLAITAGLLYNRQSSLESARLSLADLTTRVQENRETIELARMRADAMQEALENSDRVIDEQERALALASQREVEFAQRLADATNALDQARLAIARYEEPEDPETLRANRRKLLEVPDSIRIAWQPFDLPDAPAEQPNVTGDVVWNDELQQGFLRFVGLDPNDPNIEQYQVWVIDDRGMEQKVSGGVFNADNDGEIVIPIVPGIDVRRVALFAITIEEPGGTWVPDLRRRVVVAPRGEG